MTSVSKAYKTVWTAISDSINADLQTKIQIIWKNFDQSTVLKYQLVQTSVIKDFLDASQSLPGLQQTNATTTAQTTLG